MQALKHFAHAFELVGADPWLERVRPRRRAILMKRTGVVFVHVPRTAGMSIAMAVYGRFIGHFPITALLGVPDPQLLELPRFTIVRNPWDRLASAYYFAKNGGGRGESAAAVAPHVGRQIAPINSFEQFVKEWLPQQDLIRQDGILRPQAYYVVAPDGTAPFDHFGRVEHLPETEAWLSEVLGRKIQFPWTNQSPRRDPAMEYDSEMRQIVGRLYAEDIARFGYSD